MSGPPFNVPGTLNDPAVALYSGSTVVTSNDNWQDNNQGSAIQATGLDPCQPLSGQNVPNGCAQEAALLATLNPGGYTVLLSGVGGSTGVALVEVFEIG